MAGQDSERYRDPELAIQAMSMTAGTAAKEMAHLMATSTGGAPRHMVMLWTVQTLLVAIIGKNKTFTGFLSDASEMSAMVFDESPEGKELVMRIALEVCADVYKEEK